MMLVTNVDSSHQILLGFSNGAPRIAALIDGSDGEVMRRFTAIGFVEGGGHLVEYEQLEGKPFLMVSSQAGSKRRAQEILDMAKAAGAISARLSFKTWANMIFRRQRIRRCGNG